MKICNKCKKNRENKDFIAKQTDCYRCVYRAKKKMMKKRKGDPRSSWCEVCHGTLPETRRRYCSEKCLNVGKNMNKHWTLTFQRDAKNWKSRFNPSVNHIVMPGFLPRNT